MAKFLMLSRGAAITPDMSPAEIQRILERYRDWTERVRRAGNLLSGEKLRVGEGRVVRGRQGQPVITDGPYTESKEIVGGYWLLEAASYDEVVAMLKDHPGLERPGALEIRRIEEFGPRR
ncbi:MAG TPA: YciI family protein [Methylomirabilota bacterium]|nr:YciI family protein [Methylomirabilota bacterium]